MLLIEHCRIDPFVHQADGLACMMERLERFGSFGLLHDMGCGKTLTMFGAFLAHYQEDRAETMLVICPTSVIGAWNKEAKGIIKRGGAEVSVLCLMHQKVDKRISQLQEWLHERSLKRLIGEVVPPGVVVLNYESTWRMEHELRIAGFDITVCDESQRIKSAGSRQSKAMHRIGQAKSACAQAAVQGWGQLAGRRVPSGTAALRVIMTGTPVPEGALDWYGQFRFLDPTVFGTSVANFKRKYATEIDCGTFRKVVINQHALPELEAKVMERVHRVSKEEAIDLPPQFHVPYSFDLAPRQRKMYDELVQDSIAIVTQRREQDAFSGWDADLGWVDEEEIIGDNVLTRMLRLQQICGGYMQVAGRDSVEPCIIDSRGKITNPKLAVLAGLMETLRDANAKLVIFHRFTHEGQAILKLAEQLSGKHTPVSVINGQIKTADREQMVEDFQEGDTNFFVGQIQATSEGITLTAASDGAFYSLPFASAVFMQALARYHRIGQEHNVTHHHLLATRTIDEVVYDSQMRKQEAQVEHVDGGWAKFMRGELSPPPVSYEWDTDIRQVA